MNILNAHDSHSFAVLKTVRSNELELVINVLEVILTVQNLKYTLIFLLLCNDIEGLFCNCVLPVGVNEAKVGHVRAEDKNLEKKKLRSHLSRYVSASDSNVIP